MEGDAPLAPALPQPAPETPHSKQRAQELMAILVACGRFSDAQVAARCDVTPQYVSTMRQSPLFQALVQSCRERFRERVLDYVVDEIMADASDNVAWLRKLRGDGHDDDPKLLRLQLRASELLFARQVPAKQDRTDVRVGVVFDSRIVERLNKAAAIDAEVVEAPEAPCTTPQH